jgi:hypothetical protein
MAIRRMHVTVRGYYDVDMDDAEADYGTTDPEQMLQIDQKHFDHVSGDLLDVLDGDPKVVLSWEN